MVKRALAEGRVSFHAKPASGVGLDEIRPDVIRRILETNMERLDSSEHDIDVGAIFNASAAEVNRVLSAV